MANGFNHNPDLVWNDQNQGLRLVPALGAGGDDLPSLSVSRRYLGSRSGGEVKEGNAPKMETTRAERLRTARVQLAFHPRLQRKHP